jgi:hypothetical protein
VIDELDTFNAQVTLALARLARFPESPYLSCAQIGAMEPKDRETEKAAAHWVFGSASNATWFDVYRKFWHIFPYPADPVQRRLTLNAPPKAFSGKASEAITDPRLGPAKPVPEAWAAGLGQFDDFLLFSDEELYPQQQTKLFELIQPGATLTLVRPSLRCMWFSQCGVKHDFTSFLDDLEGRFVLEKVHSAEDPVLTTVIGVKDFK